MNAWHSFSAEPTTDPAWRLTIDGYDPALEPSIEAVLALVNGYSGTRAALDEGSPIAHPSTFVAGLYNTPESPQAPELNAPLPEIVVVPNWSNLSIEIGGQPLHDAAFRLQEHQRVLDLRQGVLFRTWQVVDRAGRMTALQSMRFASLANRHLLVHQLKITPVNHNATVTIRQRLDGNVRNQNDTQHLNIVRVAYDQIMLRAVPAARLRLELVTTDGRHMLAIGTQVVMTATDGSPIVPELSNPSVPAAVWQHSASPDSGITLLNTSAIMTSRDNSAPWIRLEALLDATAAAPASELLDAHVAAWAARWQHCDISIGNDVEMQQQARWACYHLIGAANPADSHTSIGARALTGERYRGHIFWDTETFVWPVYCYTDPPTARALLLFRYHTLAGAQRKAAELGYRGALFPWEATDAGEETTPRFNNVPGLGQIEILTGVQEHHIAADIAYAIVQYHTATGDHDFMRQYGAPLLLEIARFWASRAEPDQTGRYHIRAAIGPDEYHENIDDNAYTNALAAWTLRRALAAAAGMEQHDPGHWQTLQAQLAVQPAELIHWQIVADGMVTGYDSETRLYEQFAGYYQLAPINLDGHNTAHQTLDVQLGWDGVQRTQALKQADVVMLLFLLWDSFSADTRAANFAFYEPRTAHDSSLSPSIHALVAARLGRLEQAERFVRQALRIDLDFSRRGWAGATGGVHIAALGGTWQAFAFGFLGMHPSDAGLRFRPVVPHDWGWLEMPITWRNAQLRVRASSQQLTITLEGPVPVQIAVGDGTWHTLSPQSPAITMVLSPG